LRYSPVTYFHVEGGVCQLKEEHDLYTYVGPGYTYRHEVTQTYRVFAGVGLGAGPGVVTLGVEAVSAAVLAILLSGME